MRKQTQHMVQFYPGEEEALTTRGSVLSRWEGSTDNTWFSSIQVRRKHSQYVVQFYPGEKEALT